MPHSRRSFLKTAVVAGAGATLFDVEQLMAAPFVRLDVGPLTAASPALVSYAKAIKAMQLLPVTNPLSWAYQAAIHGTTLPGVHPAWNTCQHGTPFFWSWHRMYLYWFERIIRKMSGDPGFALPYWNYEKATERKLPAPFRNAASPLYTVNRGAGWNAGAASLGAGAVATSGFFPVVPYFPAQSNCEGTPHGAVHVSIGGWMGSVPTAAQDPIFYLHHANIDRLWNLWLKQGGGRTDPLTDPTWPTKKFLFFDENGKEVWMTSCDVLRATEQLNYSYQGEGTEVKEYCGKPLPWWIFDLEIVLQLPQIKLPPGPDPGPLAINVQRVRDQLMKAAQDASSDVTLELQGVEADKQPNVFWEVYVGLPKGAAPTTDSPYYAGAIALFGHGIHDEHQHDGFQPAAFSLQLDRAVQAALTRDASGSMDVSFVARSATVTGGRAPQNAATLTVGKAQLAIRRLKRT